MLSRRKRGGRGNRIHFVDKASSVVQKTLASQVYISGSHFSRMEEKYSCISSNWNKWQNNLSYLLLFISLLIYVGISLSPDGSHLLSNSMDNTLRVWDVRPFVSASNPSRCTKILLGVHHGIEQLLLRCSWSSDGKKISAGSSNR